MKRLIILVILLVAGFALYWFKFKPSDTNDGPKQMAIKTSRHSEIFNNSFDGMLNSYFTLKDAFVEADSIKAKEAAKAFVGALDGVKLEELKKDSIAIFQSATMQMSDIKLNAESLLKQPNLTEMRRDFWSVSENIYPLLKSVHYEGKTLYWQNCPMAFGDNNGANWISNTQEIVNPYLGKKHPEFKASMLHCGEVKDSIKAQ